MINFYERELLPDHVTTVNSAAIGHEHREYWELYLLENGGKKWFIFPITYNRLDILS